MSRDEVFACDMTALSGAQRAAHGELMKNVFGAVQSVRALRAGYAFRIDAEKLVDAASFILLERRCCPFFDFSLVLERRADACELHISGATGIEPFIEAEFASALPAAVGFPALAGGT
jgi:hypothetical protein